jgi:hypothetical protein
MSTTSGSGSLAVTPQQAANYPPGTSAGLEAKTTQSGWKEPVQVASAASVANLSQVLATDFDGAGQGYTLQKDDRVLVKNASSPDGVASTSTKFCGLYVAQAIPGDATHLALVRDLDADSSEKFQTGQAVKVSQGTYAGQEWSLTTANPITLGTTLLTYALQATSAPNATGGAPGGVQLANGLGGTGSTATAPVLALGSGKQSGVLPAANMDPLFNANVQVVQDAGALVAGTVTLSSGITVTATSKFMVFRNKPDTTPGHWGKLSTASPVVGGPGTGAITINSDNAADTSGVSLLIFG